MNEDYLKQLCTAIFNTYAELLAYTTALKISTGRDILLPISDAPEIYKIEGCNDAIRILAKHTDGILSAIQTREETIFAKTADSLAQTSIVVYEPKYVITVS